MRNIEGAIKKYAQKHNPATDLTGNESGFFMDRFFNGYEGSLSERLLNLIYDVFRFAYWYGYQAGKRDQLRKHTEEDILTSGLR